MIRPAWTKKPMPFIKTADEALEIVREFLKKKSPRILAAVALNERLVQSWMRFEHKERMRVKKSAEMVAFAKRFAARICVPKTGADKVANLAFLEGWFKIEEPK